LEVFRFFPKLEKTRGGRPAPPPWDYSPNPGNSLLAKFGE